jgi:protein-disulfide isomerase
MIPQWKIAALGALGGAAIAVAIVFGAAALGQFPHRDAIDGAQLRAWLLAHPSVVQDMMARLQADEDAATERAQQAAFRAAGLETFFDPKVAFVTGPANAKATLVEFYDYDCPYCRASLPAVKAFYEAHKNDTRFSFIEFPIPSQHGPSAVLAARASLAARQQPDKFVAFHFALMGEEGAVTEDMIYADAARSGMDVAKLKTDMANVTLDDQIGAAQALARRARIDGTPTFIFNGRLRAGAVDTAMLRDIMAGKAI